MTLPSRSCQVEEKNTRIQEILLDLGSDETFFRPEWLDVEQPEEVFNVRASPTRQHNMHALDTAASVPVDDLLRNCFGVPYGNDRQSMVVKSYKRPPSLVWSLTYNNQSIEPGALGDQNRTAAVMAYIFYSSPPLLSAKRSGSLPPTAVVTSWANVLYIQVERDMTVQPYESEADREARRKAEEEKRRREEEAKGANDRFRALEVKLRRGGRGRGSNGARG